MVLYNGKEIQSNKIAEPVTTLLDEGKYIRVITEFPDVSEERIHIDLENTILVISANEPESGKKYKKMDHTTLRRKNGQKKVPERDSGSHLGKNIRYIRIIVSSSITIVSKFVSKSVI